MKKEKKTRMTSFKLSKKAKLNIGISFLLILVICGLFFANIKYNETNYAVEFYRVSSNIVTNRVRVAFLTDMHLHEYGEENAELLEDIKNLAPDLIVLGGDMVTEEESTYTNMVDFCEKLTEISPVYGVWGNHEDIKMYIQNDSSLRKQFEGTGVRFLTNESETLQINGTEITICGIDGSPNNFELYGAKEAVESFSENGTGYKICVAHVPTYFSEKLSEYDFDLGLAGHTHGGLVDIPKIGPLYSEEEGFFPDYAKGMHQLENDANLVISRGLGNSSSVPRINNVPELSVIDIN